MQKILLLLAISAATLLRCNGLESNRTTNGSCEGHLINKPLISVDNLTELADQFEGCRSVSGSIIINLSDEMDLTNDDFDFLSCLEVIDGILSFENMELVEQIVIPNLRRIRGNEMIADTNESLRVLNVSGGDVIFPSLMSITRGDAVFNISLSDECGYLGIDWGSILAAGQLDNQSTNCTGPLCNSNCSSGYCWSDSHCQAARPLPQGDDDDDDDPFYIELWNDQRTWVIAVGGGIIGILLLLIICCCCCCCCCCCRRRRRRTYATSIKAVGTTDTIDAGVNKYNSFILTELPSANLESKPADPPKQHKIVVLESDYFELAQLLGNGSCGQVYKGYWHTDVDTVSYSVAIKVFATPSANYKQLVEEKLQKFTGLEHENVLRLCSVSYRSQLMLTYELAPISLRQYVIQNKLMLSALDLITMATHIAKGMSYLVSKGIAHGNLAARNVMVHQSNVAKVTDYNLYDLTTQSDWLPIRWLAPETLKYRKHNEKSDMWSYGVTIWEMLTFGAHPYHGKPTEDMLKSLENGQRLQQPVTVTADLYSILVECWWIDPMMRPSFSKMAKTMATCQSNPSQYVLTMVDSKLDTYLKLPPAATDATPYENLADIDEAGYLLMMSHVPSSPENNLDPSRSRRDLHGASINSDTIMNGQMAATTFMSADVRVKDNKYAPVAAKPVTQDEIYVNSQPEQPDDTYDDVRKPSEQLYQDEMYVNPEMTEGEMYEVMDRKDTPSDQVTEMYVLPTKDISTSACASPEKTKPQTKDQLHVVPELKHEENVYDDTTVLLNHNERGYEKMKTGVLINDINAEYTDALKQDEEALEQIELYEVPDPDGYENMPRQPSQGNVAKPPQGKPPQGKQAEDDEYFLFEKKSPLEESQIYSSVQ